MKKVILVLAVMAAILSSCNNGLSGGDYEERRRHDRSQRVMIDASEEYVDFTMEKYNAASKKREDVLYDLGGKTFYNGNSFIRINSIEGTIEMSSDTAYYKGKANCQFYGKYKLDVMAASSDCLYIRRNFKESGTIMIDNVTYINDQIPDLLVCIPLYGYSKNRIEVSPVMNGYIAMPSGTYWKK